ncbi:2,3-bisphosphoglycerate-independent phosphoglycerate mutase [compost metagenome]
MVGNSEVGHTVIGAGFVPLTALGRIQQAYENGSWADHPAWRVLADRPRVHIVGLLSDAGTHAHLRTLEQAHALATARCPRSEVIVHLILDGVDSAKGTAPALLEGLLAQSMKVSVVMGRKWFCDRSGDLALTQVLLDGLSSASDLPTYSTQELDAHLGRESEASFPAHSIHRIPLAAGEPVILTSHRADRLRQAASALARSNPVYTMVEAGPEVPLANVFFPAAPLSQGLSLELRRQGIANTRIAESSKFAHVTLFFNGLNPPAGERSICIPSIPDSDLPHRPEMSLVALQHAAAEVIVSASSPHALIINIANLDQVGHTGRFDLACEAARHVDAAVWNLHLLCQRHGWELLITADHGNADQMEDAGGAPCNSHSPHPVPLVAIPSDCGRVHWNSRSGSLANVAPTFAHLLGIPRPEGMRESLLVGSRGKAALMAPCCDGGIVPLAGVAHVHSL